MRLGKPTRLERQIAKQRLHVQAQDWMRDRGFRPMTDEEIAEAKRREAERGE